MSLLRVLYDVIPGSGEVCDIPLEQLHHIRDVRRAKKNEKIEVIDRCGYSAFAKIIHIDKDKVTLEIVSEKEMKEIFYPCIHLYCALIPEKRFDYVLQKCTEIGVTSCTPVQTQRTVVKNKTDKIARWQKICDDAARQCGGIPMTVNPLVHIKEIEEMPDSTRIIADARGEDITTCARTKNNIQLLIGPEGGFTDEEYAYACEAGWIPYTFHTNILRVETAAVVCSALLQIVQRRDNSR